MCFLSVVDVIAVSVVNTSSLCHLSVEAHQQRQPMSVLNCLCLSVRLCVAALQDYDAALQLLPEDRTLQRDRLGIHHRITQRQTPDS